MADPNISPIINNIGDVIAAIAALGTASMGLVDGSKAFWGGPSNFGFNDIKTALSPFLPDDSKSATPRADAGNPAPAYTRQTLLRTLKANWINGVDKAEQKAKAKSLIHLGLSKGNASQLAAAAGVDPEALQSIAAKTATGCNATTQELNVLGQFDAILSAVLDAGYERADQRYRNGCKALATASAIALSLFAAHFMQVSLIVGLVAGIAAVPVAPVSKDLVTSLQAAAAAIQKTNRVKV